LTDLETTRELLREWGWWAKDRRRRLRTGSAEGNWRSPQVWHPVEPRPAYSLLRAIKTWHMLRRLPTMNYRALTWRYCYPHVQVHIALRALSRRAGYRVNQRSYEDLVKLGEYKLAYLLEKETERVYSDQKCSDPPSWRAAILRSGEAALS